MHKTPELPPFLKPSLDFRTRDFSPPSAKEVTFRADPAAATCSVPRSQIKIAILSRRSQNRAHAQAPGITCRVQCCDTSSLSAEAEGCSHAVP